MILKNKDINLEPCKLFKGISETELKQTFEKIHFQIRSYENGQYIITKDTICDELLILVSGTVKAELKNLSDTVVKIADIHAPDSLASAFLFGEKNIYPVDAVAATDVNLIWIPKKEVLKMLQLNPKFLKNFLDRISTRTQYLTDKMKFLSFQTIKGKLAYFLLKTSNELKSNEFKIKKTQQELSEMFGVTRPSLARTIKQLVDEKLIHVSTKIFTIIDKKGLAKHLKYADKLHK